MQQTETDEDATSGFCTNASSPIVPLPPCLQAAARGKERRRPGMAQMSGGLGGFAGGVVC